MNKNDFQYMGKIQGMPEADGKYVYLEKLYMDLKESAKRDGSPIENRACQYKHLQSKHGIWMYIEH